MPLSTIFQLYCGGSLAWCMHSEVYVLKTNILFTTISCEANAPGAISIAVTAVSNFPVSPKAVTRLSKAEHVRAERVLSGPGSVEISISKLKKFSVNQKETSIVFSGSATLFPLSQLIQID